MKSPTAATIDSATVASTPGMVISRSTSGRPSATWPRSRSISRSSSAWKSSCRSSAAAAACSSAGRSCSASQRAALDPEQVRGRAPRHQVAVQDRVHLVLQPGPLPHDMRPAQHLPAQRRGLRRPAATPPADSPPPAAGPGSPRRPCRSSPSPRRSPGSWPGWTPPPDPPGWPAPSRSPTCSRSPPTPPHRLDPGSSANSRTPSGVVANLPACITTPALPDRDLREVAMHIQPDTPPLDSPLRHRRSPFPSTRRPLQYDRERVGEATPTDPRAQRNRAGRRGGHLLTRALSPPNKTGLPTLLHSRRPCPGRSHRMPNHSHLHQRRANSGTGDAEIFIPVTNAIESIERPVSGGP